MTNWQLFLVLLLSLLYGIVSLTMVMSLGVAAQRAFGMQREGAMGLLGIVGIIVVITANHYQIYWLSIVGGLFFAWIGLLVQGIVVVLIWHSLRIVYSAFRRLLRGNW